MITRRMGAGADRRTGLKRSSRVMAAALVAALLLAGTGCTTTRSLYPPSAAPHNALAGVAVTVRTNDGRKIEMTVVTSSAEHLVGTDDAGKSHEIPLEDIQSLDVVRFSGEKTALLAGGVIVTAAALAAVISQSMPPLTLY